MIRDNNTTVPIDALPVLPPLPLVGFKFDMDKLLDEIRDKGPLTGGIVWPPYSSERRLRAVQDQEGGGS